MKIEGYAVVVSSVEVLLLGISTAGNTFFEKPVPWSVLSFLSFVAFLGMAVLTYRMLPEPERRGRGDSRDV